MEIILYIAALGIIIWTFPLILQFLSFLLSSIIRLTILIIVIIFGIIGLSSLSNINSPLSNKNNEVSSHNSSPELFEVGVIILAFILINLIIISYVKLWDYLSIDENDGVTKEKFNYEKVLENERKRKARQPERKILSHEIEKIKNKYE